MRGGKGQDLEPSPQALTVWDGRKDSGSRGDETRMELESVVVLNCHQHVFSGSVGQKTHSWKNNPREPRL